MREMLCIEGGKEQAQTFSTNNFFYHNLPPYLINYVYVTAFVLMKKLYCIKYLFLLTLTAMMEIQAP